MIDHVSFLHELLACPSLTTRAQRMDTKYEVVGSYHVGVVADDHDDAPDHTKPWQAVAQITRIDTGAQIADAASGDWFATRAEAVAAALRAGVAKARAMPSGLSGEAAGSPSPDD
jgi:hypothetical protein